MTDEELDKARAEEAGNDPVKAARLAREGWKPPKPVDPDLLAFREWRASGRMSRGLFKQSVMDGLYDNSEKAEAFRAGYRVAREQERERARVLEIYVQSDAADGRSSARAAIAKYEESLK